MSNAGIYAREAAVRLLHAVLMEKRLLIDLVGAEDGPLVDLEPSARARAQSLAATTLRNLDRLDAVLDKYLTKKTPFALLNILRVAAAEILVDGIASHAAVDSAVTMAKRKQKTAHLKNLANAVLRKVADEGAAEFAKTAPQALPKAFVGQMKKIATKEQIAAIELAHQGGAPLDITCRDPKEAGEFAKTLGGQLMPNGSVRLQRAGQITELPGFETGSWWVQDAAASIPALALGVVEGMRVLDLCAAPGGKTMQLAATGADVTALDISQHRMRRVEANLERTGLRAKSVVTDALGWKPDAKFDAILLDAPCSATGTIRRHPDLPFAKANFDLAELLKLQRNLLAKACEWLAPGGELVFSTCSLFAAEGEGHADWLAKQEIDVVPVALDAPQLGLEPMMANAAGQIRLRPDFWADAGGMDGFFVAKFKKAS
ncbi:16S rRNA methyltransferase [Amylibacter marinus]|uniref:16S rRNA methyltransferase n=1 Tax=Amylibacter marinus TaxID=1475483 RepID=A0ABQ5VX28_9RHOB|nr:RsmB/NOP family class I SAM-dependent RNA methyltransferase [Amylibacter marinus]GLQ35762.1 16S rRNA methyltransferase [Amylibacter marinus]